MSVLVSDILYFSFAWDCSFDRETTTVLLAELWLESKTKRTAKRAAEEAR
jgi:hypothetical protein